MKLHRSASEDKESPFRAVSHNQTLASPVDFERQQKLRHEGV